MAKGGLGGKAAVEIFSLRGCVRERGRSDAG